MALKRRDFLWCLPASAGALLGCQSDGSGLASRAAYRELSATGKRSSGKSVLVCMPETDQTKEVWTSLADELGQQFELIALNVSSRDSAATIARGIERHKPSGLVLMNNPTVASYRHYQKAATAKHYPPAVIVMTSFLDGQRDLPSAATGISYEVPLITVVTNLRKLVATRIERVGVITRQPLSGFVERQAALAKLEQTQVIREIVSENPNASEIKRALRQLKEKVDALWILNDDRLLNGKLIAEGWLPGLNERPWVPNIVGASSLVSPAQSFGTFAVLPDHSALGVQAANLIFDIADNDWNVPERGAELPVSTTTTVDLPQVLERFALRDGALSQVDRILER